MTARRTVLLADMNAFYASVEQMRNPHLRGRPVIVCGDPARRRGIVLAASYEAKKYGVKTGMAVHQAKELCPHACLVPPRMERYLQVSVRIVEILKQFSPLVEPFSIDEAFVETTGCEALFGDGKTTARLIKERIFRETGLRCSIGVGPNKLMAKMAAGLEKPDGLTVLTMEDLPRRIWPLPVIELFGVGPRMERHFHRMGIRTIGDLAHADPELLQHRFGVIGRVLHQSANGIDHSPVDPHSLDENKSIGHQFTLPRDYETESDIRVVLRELAEEVASRVRRAGATGRTVSLTLKGMDFTSIHRSYTLPEPTNIGRVIFEGALHLLHRHWNHTPIRLVGISLGNLEPARNLQLDLFGRTAKDQQLADAIDHIRERFGTTSILYARSLTPASVFYDRAGKIGGHRK
ncbi:DNA polymerase IV [Polycladomyces abyssicola]|jgi:DNA polymerase-4|uniref:DNA polymerase IV n=1 Tax=Polycladomyces abyssicola TaxID=1125966 RepID=A0A8D5UH32_9BACL|nr:DNA polymerase IV [Polycladomyces abyssicola]BCU82311.1 DNA polymerase IV [Polycladomyces abyssicola]